MVLAGNLEVHLEWVAIVLLLGVGQGAVRPSPQLGRGAGAVEEADQAEAAVRTPAALIARAGHADSVR